MITEIHTEKRFFNMLTTPLQKLHYLMLFSIFIEIQKPNKLNVNISLLCDSDKANHTLYLYKN